MKLTNEFGFPPSIVRAIENDPYNAGDCDITVTGLIGPPMIRHLTKLHDAEIVEDVSDRIWALLGQVTHEILSRGEGEEELTEERLFAPVGGWIISGQFDTFDGKKLRDYKLTSAWSIVNGPKDEHVWQLRCLAWLLKYNGFPVEELELVAILRDWRKNESRRYASSGYPQKQVKTFSIDKIPDEEVEKYLLGRVAEHQKSPAPPCTSEERWDQETTYAVMKPGRKSALRVLKSQEEAEQWIAGSAEKKLSIVKRPGASVRCADYCTVAPFCDWGKQILASSEEQEQDAA